MADLADMLVGSALQTSKEAPDLSGAVQKGAQLAQTVQQIQSQRAQIEDNKQQLLLSKADKIMSAIEKGSQFKDKSAQNLFFKNYVPGMVKALKMEEFFNPELMQYVQESPEVRNKLIGLRLDIQDKINNGELKGAAIFEYAKSKLTPEELPLLDTDSFVEQQKFAFDVGQRKERAVIVSDKTTERAREGRAEAGEVELDKDVAKNYGTWKTGGGFAARKKVEGIFTDAINRLQSGEVKFGTVGKNIPWFGNPEKFPIADEKAKALLDDIRGGISIKEKTGDPNPTQTQIDAIMNRIIDPRLSNEENIKKLKTELAAMQADTQEKVKTFRRFGFDPGDSPAPGSGDRSAQMKKLKEKKPQYLKLDAKKQKTFLDEVSKKLNMTVEEVKKEMGL